MKKFILLMLVLFVSVMAVEAAEVTFAWDVNTEPDLAGYNIYQATTSGGHVAGENAIMVTCPPAESKTCTTFTHTGLTDGTYYWVATAFDEDGNESGFSNEVSLTIDTQAPGAPGSFTVTINEVKKVSVSVE